MAYQSDNWMDWLRLLGQGASAFGGMSGGLSGVGLPDAGAAATGAALQPPPVTPPPVVSGGSMMPDAGTFMPSSGSPTPWLDPAAMRVTPPAARPAAPAARPAAPAAAPPGEYPLPGPDTFASKTPFTSSYLDANEILPGPKTEGFGRTWWQRNISDPTEKAWDKAWTADPKTGEYAGLKALQGAGKTLASSLGAGGGAAAPALPAAPAGAGTYHPGQPINAAQMALQREQARQLLMQRATLNAPWLRRLQAQQGGLMG